MTAFVAAVIEAWQELRHHKLRVLLSLIGVAVAVASLTATVAAGDIAEQGFAEQMERESGRPATYSISVFDESGMPINSELLRRAVTDSMQRHQIRYFTTRAYLEAAVLPAAGKERPVSLMAVDPPFEKMHRVNVTEGRWLDAGDAANLSPALVVDRGWARAAGITRVPAATSLLVGRETVRATVIGLVPGGSPKHPNGYVLSEIADTWATTDRIEPGSYEMWLPEATSEEISQSVLADVGAAMPGVSAEVYRQDYGAQLSDDLGPIRKVVGGVAGLVLLLGALSLLNISLVTIKHRVREIGIRRSFGASGPRIFFTIMMESVVATFVAGVVGVALTVGLYRAPFVQKALSDALADPPPFPASAAVLGVLVSIGVGVLAGVLPAMIAARARIIDAIRF